MQQRSFPAAIDYLNADDRTEVLRAMERAKAWHAGQTRDSGVPFVEHPIAVAGFLASLEAERDTLVAALLHDAVEDECATLEQIEQEFGATVAMLVDGVTKLTKFHYEGRREERQLASLRKMLLSANQDLRVIFIKLADRWHNVETIDGLQEDKRQRVAMETLDIYVPFARLMGLWQLKSRFEEVCFAIAYPEECAQWHAAIAKERSGVQGERMAFVQRVNSETSDEVVARLIPMTDYEIFNKLQGNLHRLQDVENIDSVSVLITGQGATPIDCYRVLGEIHAQYSVHLGSFRDLISAPMPNGYRALHTMIFLSQKHLLKLRIQTVSMEEHASRRKLSSWVQDPNNDVNRALDSLHLTGADHHEYLEDLHKTVLLERMNVFTVSGEIITLPQHATGVDFAFALNPQHLSYLTGIRINGEFYEASHVLHEGDIVELMLQRNGGTDMRSMWVEKVRSIDAREGIKESLQKSPHEAQVDRGISVLRQELQKRHMPQWWLLHLHAMRQQLSTKLSYDSFNALMIDVGNGVVAVSTVVDVYRSMLTLSVSPLIRLLKCLGALPRSRVIDKESPIVDIEVYAQDRKGLIHDITGCFTNRDVNIAKFEVFAVPPGDALYKIRLEVPNFEVFSDLYDAVLQVPNVKEVLRKR
ncbi:HD domain-containing protein [Candidatus Peribacteria bacterium]|nr:HD domain-containing protein [Candidatus Peribacteria bacterium]